VIVNFDPDAAGANAAEKSISLLTEEGFAIKLVTLEGGLDPDRFVRERGVEPYKEAIRGARRQSDYLIARAMVQFPGASAEQKVKQLNFLLPHIRRIPEMLERSQFAQDAAQQLGIDSAVLREELRQAALKRRERVEERDKGIKRADSILVRAILAEHDLRERIAEALTEHPEWFEQLSSYSALCAMLRSVDPMAGLEDAGQRELVARIVLQAAQAPVPLSRRNSRGDLGEELAPTLELVHGTIDELHRQWLELRHRELVMDVQEAERQGDFQRAVQLAQEKLAVDRELTRIKLHGS